MAVFASSILPWLRLLRLSGAPSAASGALFGALLAGASGPPAALVAIAGALFFMGAVALNDIVDIEKDRRLRPERPLAAGTIGLGAAKKACAAIFLAGVALASLAGAYHKFWALALVAAIFAYNLWSKHGPLAGANVALCRVLNFAMGVGAVGSPSLIYPAAGLIFHALGLMALAEGEDDDRPLSYRFYLFESLAATAVALLGCLSVVSVPKISSGIAAMAWVVYLFAILRLCGAGRKGRIRAVGLLVCSYPLLEGLFLAGTGRSREAALFALFFLAGVALSRAMKAG